MDLKDDIRATVTKPFSIRQYVLQARQKDISNNWPFPDEYLKVCLKHGVSGVLPPFEPCDTIRNLCHKKDVGQNSATKENSDVGFIDQHSTWNYGIEDNLEVAGSAYMDAAMFEVSKKVSHLSINCNKLEHGEGQGLGSNCVKHLLVSKDNTSNSNPSLNHHRDQIVVALPSKAFRNKKQKHKGKPKKRLLVDILAEAKPCIFKDNHGLKESNWAMDPGIMAHGRVCNSIKTVNFKDEGKESRVSIQHDCKPILKGGIQNAKHPRDDNAGSGNFFVKRRRVVKLSLNGSKSKLCDRVIIPPGTVERDWYSVGSENFLNERKKKIKVKYDSEPKSYELYTRYGSAGDRNLSAKKKQKLKVYLKGCKFKSQSM
ncbi:uncharacterized protein LOC122086207 [Macadamia integrifolia]|uniref:uncharacterized protein LOC122086207 n=1 Tax=Macadamia integrifolia TaxID=60698 RepID=UPI001C4EC5A2|nr:uncharacterized protein LOC122086207 [Macadamia integrifolia]XP_042510875.1 uncharacterized protein LOC122086207 [Macadamia integrifolia]XP_042510876.1 uncharacterized protein LOC122086207 [Macadamia integrifolia]XP_042510877.1 uncharacterized protein LOC122086207 [Macadamia integrifolia]